MKGSTRIAGVTAILAALLAMVPGPALAYLPFCGGTWVSPGTSCQISTTGNPVWIVGSATAPGNAPATVTVKLLDSGNATVGMCSGSGTGTATCQTLVTTATATGDYTCQVSGSSPLTNNLQGAYSCGEI